MNLPEEIENTFLELASFDERIKGKRSRVRALELEKTLEVTTMQDGNGKLLLTNDKQREGAIAKALAECEEYCELATELGNLEQDKLRLTARLERLRMEFRVEMLEAEQRNHLAALKVADAIYMARGQPSYSLSVTSRQGYETEIELPF
jgi:hypothetical protein